jgi:H+-transporting ATPase
MNAQTGQTHPSGAKAGLKPDAPDSNDELKTLPMPEVEKRLQCTADGLTQTEAANRLTKYGPNEIKEEKQNPLLKFLG